MAKPLKQPILQSTIEKKAFKFLTYEYVVFLLKLQLLIDNKKETK